MAEDNTASSRKERLRRVIEQVEVLNACDLGECELPDQDIGEIELLAQELISLKSKIRKRDHKCESQTT